MRSATGGSSFAATASAKNGGSTMVGTDCAKAGVCASAAPNATSAANPQLVRTLIPSLPRLINWRQKVVAMGLVGEELFDAVAIAVHPRHEFPDGLIQNLNIKNGMLRCDKAGRTRQHLHLHPLHVDLDEVHPTGDEVVKGHNRNVSGCVRNEMGRPKPGRRRRDRTQHSALCSHGPP